MSEQLEAPPSVGAGARLEPEPPAASLASVADGPMPTSPPSAAAARVPVRGTEPEDGLMLEEHRSAVPASRWPPPRSRGLAVALALALALALAAVAVAAWSLQRTDHALRRADRLAAELRGVEESLGQRVGALEAEHRPDPADVAEVARASVFTVVSTTGRGSAWVLGSEDGRSRLVTNFHVVGPRNGPGARVQVLREEQRLDGEVVVVDERRDLAVVAVAAELPPLPIADAPPRVGDPVMVIGSPLGLEQSVVTGIVSAFRPSHVQISAPLNPGNSGGPVIDADGEVFGVAVLKVGDEATEAIGLAIPLAEVCAVTAC
ncbi:MAG: serine protease [Actinomycetota bacterium]|nr:serine protease [Actinomycetota bacterium]